MGLTLLNRMMFYQSPLVSLVLAPKCLLQVLELPCPTRSLVLGMHTSGVIHALSVVTFTVSRPVHSLGSFNHVSGKSMNINIPDNSE